MEALNALHVPDVSVTDAKPVAAAGTAPAYCDVHGTVVTKGAGVSEGLARFAMQLPEAWQQRFLFLGVGGNAGNLVPSANVTDRSLALGKGYTAILTDTGHVGDGVTAKWTRLPDGRPDTVKRTDFSYRAAHDVTVAGKAFAEAYYSAKVEHAYFDGCSTGGRMAMMEAERYPEDYEGVIAGDPLMSSTTSAARAVVQNAALSSPAAYIPEATIAAIDARVTGRCDAIDGAKDSLVQNPSSCPVHAEDLLCRAGETEACLNADQMRAEELHLAVPRYAGTCPVRPVGDHRPLGASGFCIQRNRAYGAGPVRSGLAVERPQSGAAVLGDRGRDVDLLARPGAQGDGR